MASGSFVFCSATGGMKHIPRHRDKAQLIVPQIGGQMEAKAYTFFMHGGPTLAIPFEISFFKDDDLAKRRAQELLAERPQYHTVEVTKGGETFEVKRTTGTF